jgi:hypothetical protein
LLKATIISGAKIKGEFIEIKGEFMLISSHEATKTQSISPRRLFLERYFGSLMIEVPLYTPP